MGHFRLFVGQKWGSFPSVKVLSPDSEPVTATGSDNRPTRYYITGNGFVKRGCGNFLKKTTSIEEERPESMIYIGNGTMFRNNIELSFGIMSKTA